MRHVDFSPRMNPFHGAKRKEEKRARKKRETLLYDCLAIIRNPRGSTSAATTGRWVKSGKRRGRKYIRIRAGINTAPSSNSPRVLANAPLFINPAPHRGSVGRSPLHPSPSPLAAMEGGKFSQIARESRNCPITEMNSTGALVLPASETAGREGKGNAAGLPAEATRRARVANSHRLVIVLKGVKHPRIETFASYGE